MKKLYEYIHSMEPYYEADMRHGGLMEQNVNKFIRQNYEKIKPGQYFYCDFDDFDGLYMSVDPSFEEELKIHYPEKLI